MNTDRPNYPRRCAFLFPILALTIFAQTPGAGIQSLIDRKEYFKAKDSLAVCAEMLPVEKSIYFGAILDNVFNRPIGSNEKIRHCLEFSLSDTLVAELLKTKLNNDIRLNDFQSATSVTDTLLNRYIAFLDSATRTDIGNDGKAWRALATTPTMTANISREATLPMKKDIVGLLRIPVRFGKKSMKFVFDTGAQSTMLYPKFYKKYAAEIDSTCELGTIISGSAGGMEKNRAYNLTNVQMRIAGRDVTLPKVSLLKDVQTEHSKYFFGNLGQDALRQFKTVIINFDKMFVAFE